jgi:sterol desaturase/sphingolipid hydroxylase (fatty acid hydroxylase superfamily)
MILSRVSPVAQVMPPAPPHATTKRRASRPTVVVAAVTAGLMGEGLRAIGGWSAAERAIQASRAQLVGPLVLGFVALVFLAERRWPRVVRPVLARGHVQDALYTVFYAILVVPLIVLTGVGFAALLHRVAGWSVLPRSALVPRWVVVVGAVVAIDALNWLAHLANHRVAMLWRLHAVHHSQEEMSVLTSFRAHPLVHASFLITVLPTFVLVANGTVPGLVFSAYACYAALGHANLRWDFGPFRRILVSPAYHQIHHRAEGRNDINLGNVLTLWDVLAHRAVFPAHSAAPVVTGLSGRPVPVEQQVGGRGHLATLAIQLAEPFGVVRSDPTG